MLFIFGFAIMWSEKWLVWYQFLKILVGTCFVCYHMIYHRACSMCWRGKYGFPSGGMDYIFSLFKKTRYCYVSWASLYGIGIIIFLPPPSKCSECRCLITVSCFGMFLRCLLSPFSEGEIEFLEVVFFIITMGGLRRSASWHLYGGQRRTLCVFFFSHVVGPRVWTQVARLACQIPLPDEWSPQPQVCDLTLVSSLIFCLNAFPIDEPGC